jgi:hypothetical protein
MANQNLCPWFLTQMANGQESWYKMNEKEFIWWLLGFVYNKSELESFEVDIIRDKIDKILKE